MTLLTPGEEMGASLESNRLRTIRSVHKGESMLNLVKLPPGPGSEGERKAKSLIAFIIWRLIGQKELMTSCRTLSNFIFITDQSKKFIFLCNSCVLLHFMKNNGPYEVMNFLYFIYSDTFLF